MHKSNKKLHWKTISTRIVYRNPWIKVREDQIVHPNNKKGIYGVVEIPPGIFVIAQNPDQQILFIEQNRYPTGITSWELPGGGLKTGHTIKQQALEEIQEEARITAKHLKLLGKTQTQPGITNQIDYFFVATGISPYSSNKIKNLQCREGISGVSFFAHEEIKRMILNGSISHAQSITGYSLFMLRNEK